MKHKSFQDTIAYANDQLDNNTEWKKRYKTYTHKVDEKIERYIKAKSKFRNGPFTVYTSLSKMMSNSTLSYDLRYLGQSVATISLISDDVFISTSGKSKTNLSYFGVKTKLPNKTSWSSSKADKFRVEFRKCIEPKVHSKEHLIESELLKEFSKESSRDKVLCNIQPVTIGKMYFQFPTPLTASGYEVNYSGDKGGGIDILARVKQADNCTRICVMELKDQNTGSEPPEKVISQAIAYATFIARLLRDEQGQFWYNLFGFSGQVPKELVIDVVCVVPFDTKKSQVTFEEQRYEVCKDTFLELHTLFFTKEDNPLFPYKFTFTGSLKDSLLKKN